MGQAEVVRQGLYYEINCRCRLPENRIFRVALCIGDGWENLGVLVPEGDAFCLKKRLAAKKYGSIEAEFRVYGTGENPMETFVPLDPNMPVDCLPRLKEARFARRGDVPGLLFGT